MAKVIDRINNWRLSELRWASQVNEDVLVAWYNKWLQIFQKELLEYVANTFHVNTVTADITKDKVLYDFPFWVSNVKDFYSIVQLRVAYKKDKDWNPIYVRCEPISLTDYNTDTKTGKQHWRPYIYGKISMAKPRYSFVGSDQFRLYPTPTENISNWIILDFNYFVQPVSKNTEESTLDLPWYFLDVIDDYLSFRLYQAENPEMAQTYYQQFLKTLQDNIYWLNRDKRPIEEWFANLSYFDHF